MLCTWLHVDSDRCGRVGATLYNKEKLGSSGRDSHAILSRTKLVRFDNNNDEKRSNVVGLSNVEVYVDRHNVEVCGTKEVIKGDLERKKVLLLLENRTGWMPWIRKQFSRERRIYHLWRE